MKKIILLTFFSCLVYLGHAQSVLEQSLDFTVNNLPLKKAIFQLSKQLNVGFTFNGAIIPDKTITVKFAQADLTVILANFFEHKGKYDLIIEQTFLCSFPPTTSNRASYAIKMHELLAEEGKLVGVWFNVPLTGDMEKRPFGGNKEEYLKYLSPYFNVKTFESCHNSIEPSN